MTVTKKQTSIAVFAVIFATAMIAGTLASAASDNMAFANRNHHHHGNHHHNDSHDQSISQNNSNKQSSKCVASGGVSVANGGLVGVSIGGTGGSIRNSCNNDSTQTNANSGNNVR
jgi:Ni/Co efflux regulator RcnB